MKDTKTLRVKHLNLGQTNQHLKDILNDTISTEELQGTISNLDTGAGAGILAIRLIKIVTSWEIEKIEDQTRS